MNGARARAETGGSIAFRFHARDAHLVAAPGAGGPIPFSVRLDGVPPGPRERTLEITLLEAGQRPTRSPSDCSASRRGVEPDVLSTQRQPQPGGGIAGLCHEPAALVGWAEERSELEPRHGEVRLGLHPLG
jgi:hypothetical protein